MSKKHKADEEHENHERWLVSYADFITLLFAFFVVMYATSNSDLEKQKKFEGSLKESMKIAVTSDLKILGSHRPNKSSSSNGNSPIPNLKYEQPNHSSELEDYVRTFFNNPDPRVQRFRKKIKILSEPEGVVIGVNKSELIGQEELSNLIILGSLFKKADTNIQLQGKTQEHNETEIAQNLIHLRNRLISIAQLSDKQISILILGQQSTLMEPDMIRFAMTR